MLRITIHTMKKLMSMALIVAMGAVACQKEGPDYSDNSTPTDGGYLTFSADFVKLASKTAASFDESSNTLTLAWEEGDQVGVYSGQTPILFTASSAGATTTLTSNIKVARASSYSAVYPYMTDALMEAGSLVMTVPAEQIAKADSPKYHVAVAQTTSNSLAFKNVTAAVRLNLMAENVTKIELKANGGENISGIATVNTSNATVSALANGSSVVTLVPAAGVSTIEPGIYYASVVPQTLSQGFTVTYHVGANTFDQASEESLSLDGNTLVVCEGFGTAVEGSQSNPFTVGSVDDLKGLSAKLSLDVPNYVVLTKDIDMSGVKEWTPINNDRTAANVREIHFDGRNHKISNFAPTTVTNGPDGKTNYSFFGILFGSCKNLTMENAVINHTGSSTTAVLAAYAGYPDVNDAYTTVIENVHVSGTVNAKKVVAGFAADFCKVKFVNCSADVDVTASDYHVGGFVARVNDSGKTEAVFEDCFTTGDVTCTKTNKGKYTGGFYGGNETTSKMTFTRCYTTGKIVTDMQFGGIIGYLDVNDVVTLNDCYSTSNLSMISGGSNGKQLGGIVGTSKGTLTINRCYFAGSLNSGKGESVGGILGLNAQGTATITGCFSIADLTAPTYGVGGIVGYTKATSLAVSNCYAAGTLSTKDKVGGIVGLAETAATLTGCLFGGTLPGSATDCDAVVGKQVVEATISNCSAVADADKANYATASKIASTLGWSTDVWDLSGNAPVLK